MRGVARTLELVGTDKNAAPNSQNRESTSHSRDLRAETRVSVKEQFAEVTILCWGAPKTSARILDISRSGIGLVLQHHLPEGTWIKLKIGQVLIFGYIRYCRGTAEGTYRAGLISDTVITNPS
jgi:hypothetical protein